MAKRWRCRFTTISWLLFIRHSRLHWETRKIKFSVFDRDVKNRSPDGARILLVHLCSTPFRPSQATGSPPETHTVVTGDVAWCFCAALQECLGYEGLASVLCLFWVNCCISFIFIHLFQPNGIWERVVGVGGGWVVGGLSIKNMTLNRQSYSFQLPMEGLTI